MKLRLIWVRDNDVIWLQEAFDEPSINDGADVSYEEELGVLRVRYGADNVRVQIANIDVKKVDALFEAPEVDLT